MYLYPPHLHIIYAQYIILITRGKYVPTETDEPFHPLSQTNFRPSYLPARSTLHVIVST